MVPDVISAVWARSRMTVKAETDLPEPDSPTMATISPGNTVYPMFSTARTSPCEERN